MNNIRKIITERLENARNDYEQAWAGTTIYDILQGQIEAYQDCLNLLPAPRTEQEILKEFEKLGREVTQNDNGFIILCFNSIARIVIFKGAKQYSMNNLCTMQEHKLLNELFEVIFNE